MKSIDVVTIGAPHPGWGPVDRLALVAADLLNGRVFAVSEERPNIFWRLSALTNRTIGPEDRGILVLARSPHHLKSHILAGSFLRNYGFAAIWVIDAFRHEDIPPRWTMGPFDLVAVCRPNDEEIYAKNTGKPVVVLPWGTDAFELGSANAARDVDVMRLGRQPEEWDDDATTARQCAANQLRFAGRPPQLENPLKNHESLMASMCDAKFVVAFSNLAAPAPYTHPTEEYVTARWTDALAAGSTVAGIAPHKDATLSSFWPGSLLEFDHIDLKHNISALREAKAIWTADKAVRNHREAIARLDWRWRIKTLADLMELWSPKLDATLDRLKQKLHVLDIQIDNIS